MWAVKKFRPRQALSLCAEPSCSSSEINRDTKSALYETWGVNAFRLLLLLCWSATKPPADSPTLKEHAEGSDRLQLQALTCDFFTHHIADRRQSLAAMKTVFTSIGHLHITHSEQRTKAYKKKNVKC